MRAAVSVLSMLALAVTAPLTAEAKDSKDESAIRANSAAFVAAYNSGDVEGVVKHFADTAVVMPPSMPPMRGRDQVRQFVTGGVTAFKTHGLSLDLAAGSDVGVSGDLGWHSGTYTVNRAGVALDNGKYLETWQKSGGQWHMIRRMWNSDRSIATK